MSDTNNPYNPLFLIDYHNKETFHSKLIKLFLDVNNSEGGDDFEYQNIKNFIGLLNRKIDLQNSKRPSVDYLMRDEFLSIHNELCIEMETQDGQTNNYLDVYINYGSTVIVIENKIDAKEGVMQVARYLKWLNEGDLNNIDDTNKHLVYLTIDGSDPSPVTEKVIRQLGYKEDEIQSKYEKLNQLRKQSLICVSWPELIEVFSKEQALINDDYKSCFYKAIFNHFKLNFMIENDNNKQVLKWFYGEGNIEPSPVNLKIIKQYFNQCVYQTTLDFFQDLNNWMSEKGYTTSGKPLKKSPPKKDDCGWVYQVYQKEGLSCDLIIYRHTWLGIFPGAKSGRNLDDNHFKIEFTAGKNQKDTLQQVKLFGIGTIKDDKEFRVIDKQAIDKNINLASTKSNSLEKIEKKLNEIEKRLKQKNETNLDF